MALFFRIVQEPVATHGVITAFGMAGDGIINAIGLGNQIADIITYTSDGVADGSQFAIQIFNHPVKSGCSLVLCFCCHYESVT